MKILAIMGSPHDMRGNTGRLLEEVLSGVQQTGAEIEIISLAKKRLRRASVVISAM
jgi:multimeric flavodoxin WrbA